MGLSEGLHTLTRFTNADGCTCNLYDEYDQIDASSIITQCEPFMDKHRLRVPAPTPTTPEMIRKEKRQDNEILQYVLVSTVRINSM